MSETMTGAELQILREACGLTREEFGGMVDVQARSVKYWESGRFGVPADVADIVLAMDAKIEARAQRMLARTKGGDVLLMSTDKATVARVAVVMRARGTPCRVINFDAVAYAQWCQSVGLSGSGYESNWAVHAVRTMQAHRGDQPR